METENLTFQDEDKKDDIDSEKNLKLKRRYYRKVFLLNSTQMGLAQGASLGLVSLQSSINMEEGLGMKGLMATFGMTVIGSLTLTPFVLQIYGPKITMLLGQIAILIYTVANLYPVLATIIPASIIFGFMESFLWAGANYTTGYCAIKFWENHSKADKEKKNATSKEETLSKFYNWAYFILTGGMCVGSTLSYLVLFNMMDEEENSTNSTNITLDDWSKCGANFCLTTERLQNFTQTTEADKYIPKKISIYVLLGLFLLVQVVSVGIIAFFIPYIPPNVNSEKKSDPEKKKCFPEFLINIKNMAKFSVSKQQLLVVLFEIKYGLFVGFFVSEFTRSFVSCTLGVEKVGINMAVYSIASVIWCMISAKFASCFGRIVPMVVLAGVQLLTYIFMMVWTPDDTMWIIIYLIAIVFGILDVNAYCCLQAFVASFFENQLTTAISLQNCIVGIGIFLQTVYSSYLCVTTQICILITLLAISQVLWLFAEYRHKKKEKKEPQSV